MPLFYKYNHLSNYTKTIIHLRLVNIGEYSGRRKGTGGEWVKRNWLPIFIITIIIKIINLQFVRCRNSSYQDCGVVVFITSKDTLP